MYYWYERIVMPINRFSQRLIPMPQLAKWQAQAMGRHSPAAQQFTEEALLQLTHEPWLRLWDTVSRMESLEDLNKIACPTLILKGDDDWLTHRQQAILTAQIVGAQDRILPNAGRATNLDNPQAVNRTMAEFLAAQGTGGS